jgi:hypothetical protein
MTRETAGQEAATPAPRITTLYDLLTALQEVVGPDDGLVVATVVHLLRSRRLTWPRQAGAAPGTLRCGAAQTSPGGVRRPAEAQARLDATSQTPADWALMLHASEAGGDARQPHLSRCETLPLPSRGPQALVSSPSTHGYPGGVGSAMSVTTEGRS